MQDLKKKKSKKYSQGSLLGGNKAMVGMGLLGLAFAAMEHFQQKSGSGFPGTPPPSGGLSFGGPANVPPPPPAPGPGSVPPPPPIANIKDRQNEALLILRAMIAASHADYTIDAEERQRIIDKTKQAGLSAEEIALVAEELNHPKGLAEIARAVKNTQQAEEIYVASLLAIDVDSEAEKAYLRALAERLGLSPEIVHKWHEQFELSHES